MGEGVGQVWGKRRGGGGAARRAPRRAGAGGEGPGPLRLFTHTLCPYAQRVQLALREKGAAFDLEHIDLAAKPAWFFEVNPRGLVPALQHANGVEVESLDILRWVDRHVDTGPSLMPADAGLAALADQILREQAGRVVSSGLAAVGGSTAGPWAIGERPTAGQVERLAEDLRGLERALEHGGGPFLAGPAVSLADLAVYPFLERFAVAWRIEGAVSVAALNGPVAGWMERMKERPSSAWAAADEGALLEAYRRHRSLDFFDRSSHGQWDLHPHNRSP